MMLMAVVNCNPVVAIPCPNDMVPISTPDHFGGAFNRPLVSPGNWINVFFPNPNS